MTRLAVSAPPGTMQPLEIETAGGRLIDGAAGRCRFAVADKAMQPSIEKPLTVPVGKRMSAAYLLVGVEVNEEKRETFAKLFQKKNAWAGVAIGELTLNFADGTQAQRSLMHGVDVVDTTKRELPFTYNAIDYWREPKGRIWAVVQWPNPHPEKRVEKLVFSHAGTAAQPMLKAASIESIDN